MLNSQSAITAIRRYSSPQQLTLAVPRDRRDLPGERLTPTTASSKAEENSFSASTPATAPPVRSPVFGFFLERWRGEQRNSISLVSSPVHAEMAVWESEDNRDRTAFGSGVLSTRNGFASPAREVDRYRPVNTGWLAMIWRGIASWWAKWRREREIKKAVAALAEYDDRVLRDMGIPDRSSIEQIVRYGRDY